MNLRRHLFEFLVDHQTRYHYQPTRSELRRVFAGLTDDVDLHLEQLAREGLLKLGDGGSDPVILLQTFPLVRHLELRGGMGPTMRPVDHPCDLNTIALELRGAGMALDGDLFAQIVADDSMIDAGIHPRDVAVLKAATPQHGDIVVVEKAGRFVLRRYLILAGIPHLLTENPAQPDLVSAFDQSVHGVLCCLISPRPGRRGGWEAASRKVSYLSGQNVGQEAGFTTMPCLTLRNVPGSGFDGDGGHQHRLPPAVRKKPAAAPRARSKSNQKWPAPPSGFTLNDTAQQNYCAGTSRTARNGQPDQQPHASACTDVPSHPVAPPQKARQRRRSRLA